MLRYSSAKLDRRAAIKVPQTLDVRQSSVIITPAFHLLHYYLLHFYVRRASALVVMVAAIVSLHVQS